MDPTFHHQIPHRVDFRENIAQWKLKVSHIFLYEPNWYHQEHSTKMTEYIHLYKAFLMFLFWMSKRLISLYYIYSFKGVLN